jgi:membrane-associated phospholipid phosphatase
MTGLGLLVTKPLADNWPFDAEDAVSRELAADRTPAWTTVSGVVSDLASTPVAFAATAAVAGLAWLLYRRWREPVFVLGAMAAESVVFFVTTLAVDRTRPAVPHLDTAPPTSSFPSGHTSAAVTLYGATALLLVRYAWQPRPRPPAVRGTAVLASMLLLAVPVAVAASRLYRGMHYPSDVAASFVDGLACLAIVGRAVLSRRWPGAGTPRRGTGRPRTPRRSGRRWRPGSPRWRGSPRTPRSG